MGKESVVERNLFSENYEMPNSPPFGKQTEQELVDNIKNLRNKAFDPSTGKKYKDRAHAADVANYENARHELIVKYAFIVHKSASAHCKQCQLGMEYGDLSQIGFQAVANALDKWPPFHGAEDKSYRLYTFIQKAVDNEIRRFLDNYNRNIRIPGYKIEQIGVRLDEDNIKYGKQYRNRSHPDACKKSCDTCQSRHGPKCRRKKPGKFEELIKKMMKTLNLDYSDVDGRSVRDIAGHTGKAREIAKIFDIDVNSFVAMIESTSSIDSINEEDGDGMAQFISNPKNDICSEDRANMRDTIEEALRHIPQRNAEIVRDHFFNNLSMNEIAKKYGFTKTRASHLVSKGIGQIKSNSISLNILVHKIIGK